MKKSPPKTLYSLVEIPVFDARSGLVRCSIKGIGAFAHGYASPNADFWRSADGSIMLRVSLKDARCAFEARLITGEPIPDDTVKDFSMFVSEQLLRWATDIDDEPFEEVSFPAVIVPPVEAYWTARLLWAWVEFEYESRYPEIVLELIPEFSDLPDMQLVADEEDFGYRYSRLFDAVQKLRKQLESTRVKSTDQVAKKLSAKTVGRLSELEHHLVVYSVTSPWQLKRLKSEETADKSILWENDPSLVSKDAAYWRKVNVIGFGYNFSKGVRPGDASLAQCSTLSQESYAMWFKSREERAK